MSRIDYDEFSERYDRSRRFDSELTRELLVILPDDFAPHRALDAGCGTANATACLADAFPTAKITGLDLSAGMLSKARGKHPELPLVRGDSAALPFASGLFDLVLSAYMLHHLERPADFYAQVARSLARGGKFIALTAGHEQIRAHFLNEFFPRFGKIDCARFPSLADVEGGLRDAGLAPSRRRDIPVAEYAVDELYLERVRNKHISTFELMSDEEFAEGLRAITEWVRAHGGGEKKRRRHTARGTLILAEKH